MCWGSTSDPDEEVVSDMVRRRRTVRKRFAVVVDIAGRSGWYHVVR